MANRDKTAKVSKSARIREDILKMSYHIEKMTGLNYSNQVELALLDFLLKIKINFNYNGLDFKRHLQLVKAEKMRNFAKKERIEFLSKNLMMARLRKDILKILLYNKKNTDKINKAIELIDKYIIEAKQYVENEEIVKELETYKINAEKHIEKFTLFIENEINSDYMEVSQYGKTKNRQ